MANSRALMTYSYPTDTHARSDLQPRRALATSENDPRKVPPIVHDVLRTAGRPLDPQHSATMERPFERDFSGVRVHADDMAARSAQAVAAQAYTVAPHIVFGAGR